MNIIEYYNHVMHFKDEIQFYLHIKSTIMSDDTFILVYAKQTWSNLLAPGNTDFQFETVSKTGYVYNAQTSLRRKHNSMLAD